jgi:hypothetical protein
MYQYVIMSSQIFFFLALTWTKFIFMARGDVFGNGILQVLGQL